MITFLQAVEKRQKRRILPFAFFFFPFYICRYEDIKRFNGALCLWRLQLSRRKNGPCLCKSSHVFYLPVICGIGFSNYRLSFLRLLAQC